MTAKLLVHSISNEKENNSFIKNKISRVNIPAPIANSRGNTLLPSLFTRYVLSGDEQSQTVSNNLRPKLFYKIFIPD